MFEITVWNVESLVSEATKIEKVVMFAMEPNKWSIIAVTLQKEGSKTKFLTGLTESAGLVFAPHCARVHPVQTFLVGFITNCNRPLICYIIAFLKVFKYKQISMIYLILN